MLLYSFITSLLWARVIVTPLLSKIIVFRRGTWNGLSNLIPVPGHTLPKTGEGDRELWKNPQKNPLKNSTSLIIKSRNPNFNNLCTLKEWDPSITPSRITSRHHRVEMIPHSKNDLTTGRRKCSLKKITDLLSILEIIKAIIKGQGEGVTRWYRWAMFTPNRSRLALRVMGGF